MFHGASDVTDKELDTEPHAQRNDDHPEHRRESPAQDGPHPSTLLVDQLRELERNDVVAALVAIWRYGMKNRPLSATESRENEPPR